jgi:hypothetical protein
MASAAPEPGLMSASACFGDSAAQFSALMELDQSSPRSSTNRLAFWITWGRQRARTNSLNVQFRG